MSEDETTNVFRVTVRGQFSALTDQARSFLQRSQADHEVFKSAYTKEGTFTYDDRLVSFNLRYELRASGPDASTLVELEAVEEAERFLTTMGIGWKRLRTDVTDMSAMTNGLRRRR